MTKHDLVARIAKSTGIGQSDVADVVQRILDLVVDELASGGGVELRNFGVFGVAVRRSRIGQDMRVPGTAVRIPPRVVVRFRPGKVMRERVLELKPEQFAGMEDE